jgi:hypothetical protein
MSVVSTWRDNLNIGIYLTQYGAQPKENILQYMGYTPDAPNGTDDYDGYYRRFRAAIDMGAEGYTKRESGWFYIMAFPFDTQFLYRAVWYIDRRRVCVPLATDLLVGRIKEWRTKDTNTRIARTRASVAADALSKIRRAMRNGDIAEYNEVMRELGNDETYGPIMEIVTGHYGVEYAELGQFISLLLEYPGDAAQRLGLKNALQDIRKAKKLQKKSIENIARSLSSLVMLRAGQRDQRPRALVEARTRLESLPEA